jgi:hypothetical protein
LLLLLCVPAAAAAAASSQAKQLGQRHVGPANSSTQSLKGPYHNRREVQASSIVLSRCWFTLCKTIGMRAHPGRACAAGLATA